MWNKRKKEKDRPTLQRNVYVVGDANTFDKDTGAAIPLSNIGRYEIMLPLQLMEFMGLNDGDDVVFTGNEDQSVTIKKVWVEKQ